MRNPDDGGYAPELAQSVRLGEVERQREAGWVDWHPEQFCHRCGNRNCGWWVDGDEWNRAVANEPRGVVSILCPSCFADLWQRETGLSIHWEIRMDTQCGDLRRLREWIDALPEMTEPHPRGEIPAPLHPQEEAR